MFHESHLQFDGIIKFHVSTYDTEPYFMDKYVPGRVGGIKGSWSSFAAVLYLGGSWRLVPG